MKCAASVFFFLAALVNGATAEFNQCLGTQIYRLPSIDNCGRLYDACQAGVAKLNTQLHTSRHDRFHAVSLVSATESKAKSSEETMIAMLVQIAPIAYCAHSSAAPPNSSLSGEKCTFDMAKIEIYSILLRQESPTAMWTLDGYKHHALTDEDRQEIVANYQSGHFFGTNLAIGIFDTPNLPAQVTVSDSINSTLSRSPVVVFAAIACVTVSLGLLFHHRRRLNNGYAPITVMKRGKLEAKSLRRPTSASSHLGASAPVLTTEEMPFRPETSERFAV